MRQEERDVAPGLGWDESNKYYMVLGREDEQIVEFYSIVNACRFICFRLTRRRKRKEGEDYRG